MTGISARSLKYMRAFADRTGVPLAEIRALYAGELARLARGATVRRYLTQQVERARAATSIRRDRKSRNGARSRLKCLGLVNFRLVCPWFCAASAPLAKDRHLRNLHDS
jgi:hypothetical protein